MKQQSKNKSWFIEDEYNDSEHLFHIIEGKWIGQRKAWRSHACICSSVDVTNFLWVKIEASQTFCYD